MWIDIVPEPSPSEPTEWRLLQKLLALPIQPWQWTLAVALTTIGCLGLAIVTMPTYGPSRIKDTEIGVQAVRGATTMYLAETPNGGCPTVNTLIAGDYLDEDKSTTDAWDNPFTIACEGTRVTVTSAGPDETFGTDDDID